MTIFEAIIEGVIQGATEFLPVSSSGHLSLFHHFTGQRGEAAVVTTIALHLGTLAAVFIAFRQKIGELIKEFFLLTGDLLTGKFRWWKMNGSRRMIIMIIISILPLFGFYIFRGFFKSVSYDDDILAEGICFLYTAGLLALADKRSKEPIGEHSVLNSRIMKSNGEVTVKDAVIIGFFQGVALLPGVSRSGSTIAGGLLAGMKREDAVEYSFILGIPVIIASAVSEFTELDPDVNIELIPIAAGIVTAALAGYLSISLINWLMKTDRFGIFSVYTFFLGIAVIIAGAYEHITGSIIKINIR